MRQPAELPVTRAILHLKIFDAALQLASVLALVVAIVALQTRLPCHLYLLAAPILPLAIWAGSGLVIDRQALRAPTRR